MSEAGQGDVRLKVARYVDLQDLDTNTAARDITSSISECKNLQEVEDLCYSIVCGILEMLLDVPERIDSLEKQETTSDKLVGLCKAIKELPTPLDQDGNPYLTWAGQPWHNLPMLGAEVRERWNAAPRIGASPGECYSDEAWIALNLFAAKLTANGILDFSLYAIWQLREALEGDIPWCPPGPACIAVPAAAHWVRIAGEALIRRDDDYGRAAQGGELWKGKNGFCVERWMLWKTQFKARATEYPDQPGWGQMCSEAANRIAMLLRDTLNEVPDTVSS